MNIHDATEVAYKNGYANGKADAVKEIFAEIDNNFIIMSLHDKYETFSELKKKYTEVTNDRN